MVNSITEYISFFEAGEDMTDEEYGKYMRVIHNFAFLDIEPDYTTLPPLVKAALRTVIANLRASKEARQNGGKGGRPKKEVSVIEEKQEKPQLPENENLGFEKIETPVFENDGKNENPFSEKTETNGNGKGNVNGNLNSFDAPAPTDPKKQPKPPLTDREPVNDLERVEKAYLDHYASLYDKGILKIPKPCVNWGQCRKLERERITEYGLEKILSALEKAMQDNFCVQKGYSLSTILSAGTLNSILNGNGWKHDQRAIDSVDRVTDAELSDVPF